MRVTNRSMLSLLLFCLINVLLVSSELELARPKRYHVYNSSTLYLNVVSQDRLIYDDSNEIAAIVRTRVYCPSYDESKHEFNESDCSIPGPTLLFKAGETSNIVLVNRLVGIGLNNGENLGNYRDMDVINLHTHGLHDNPMVDNIVNFFVWPICPESGATYASENKCWNPGNTTGLEAHWKEYNYEILRDHYPGSHWYHAHWHGSTTVHVAAGMYGAIEMLPLDPLKDCEPQIDEEHDHVLLVSYVWLHDQSRCNEFIDDTIDEKCNTAETFEDFKDVRGTDPMHFPVQSLCLIYCKLKLLQPNQYENSQNQYYVTVNRNDGYLRGFLVNGQLKPTLKITTGEWHRLRITNTNMQYLLWTPSNSADGYERVTEDNSDDYPCQNWLISRDGVFFEYGPRKLWETPYDGSAVIPPGSRAEFLIICNETGNFSFWADDNTRSTALDNAPVPTEKQLLLKLVVESGNDVDLKDTCNGTDGWNAPELPCTPQPYLPHSPYLKSTLDTEYPDVTSNCSSNHSVDDLSQCSMVFRRNEVFAKDVDDSQVSINGIEFDTDAGMFNIPSNVTYEWLITSNFHPMHHHTWPYQVQLDLGGGWIAQAGDWRDTLGAPGSYRVRTNMYDYLEGKLVMHCHFVPHEDHGMMTWHQLGGYKGTRMIPKKNDADGSFNLPPSPTRYDDSKCDELYAISLIDSLDTETLFLTGVRIFEYEGYCYLGIFNFVDLRNAGVENFWVGLGFGGSYADGNRIDDSNMTGNALIWSLQATDDGPFDDIGYTEIELIHHTVPIVPKSKTKMSCGGYNSSSIDGENYAYWFCVRPITTTFFGDKIVYDNDKLGYIWSYGEGRYTQYNMHAIRGGCQFKYSEILDGSLNNWNQTNATVCEHFENEISIKKGQNNQKLQKLFFNAPFPPLNATEWIEVSGYDEAVENLEEEEELAVWVIVIICVAVLIVVIVIIYIVWRRCKLKDKKDEQSDKAMMQVAATSGQSSAQPSGQPSGQSTPK